MRGMPFTEADFVGPEDRPKPDWTLTMYGWQTHGNPTIKGYFDESAGGLARAVRCAPKAHNLTLSADHRSVSWSLYTPLLAFTFPKVNEKYKAVFKCRPETFGETKVLVIDVASYRLEKIDREGEEQAAAAKQGEGPMMRRRFVMGLGFMCRSGTFFAADDADDADEILAETVGDFRSSFTSISYLG